MRDGEFGFGYPALVQLLDLGFQGQGFEEVG